MTETVERGLILGCGYLGERLALQALARGARLQALTRNPEQVERLAALGIDVWAGEIGDPAWLGWADRGADWAVNCVGASGGGLAGYRASYVEGNRRARDWLAKGGFAGRALYTSSVSVYPDAGGGWVAEEAAAPPSERGALALESERRFLEGGPGRARRAVLRLAGLYGPGRVRLAAGLLGPPGAPVEDPHRHMNLIRVEDAAEAVWRVLGAESMPDGTVFNVADDEPARRGEIAAWLRERAAKEGLAPEVEQALAQGGAPRAWARSRAGVDRRVSSAALKRATGWAPRHPSFREGLAYLLAGR